VQKEPRWFLCPSLADKCGVIPGIEMVYKETDVRIVDAFEFVYFDQVHPL
jgi:hypothetical protein